MRGHRPRYGRKWNPPGVYEGVRRDGKHRDGVNVLVTEAQTLEEAVDILAAEARRLHRVGKTHPMTLKQEFALVKGRLNSPIGKLIRKRISLAKINFKGPTEDK